MNVGEIPYDFIKQRTELCWNEIKFGLDNQLLAPKAAIERATEQLCATNAPSKEILELASLSENEPSAELVSRLAEAETAPGSESLKAKWLYLVLAWLFENRQSLVDALGVVEEVYSDFDYPREIAPFVRYMPMEKPDSGNQEQNEARLFEHWKAYLDEAARRFAQPGQTFDTNC